MREKIDTAEKELNVLVLMYEAPVTAPPTADLDFRLVQVTPHKDSVEVKLRYGGGCVQPHIFEMYTSAMPDSTGVITIYLAHQTHHDKCRAFVFTERTYLWSHLFNPGQKVKINDGEIIEIPDK